MQTAVTWMTETITMATRQLKLERLLHFSQPKLIERQIYIQVYLKQCPSISWFC